MGRRICTWLSLYFYICFSTAMKSHCQHMSACDRTTCSGARRAHAQNQCCLAEKLELVASLAAPTRKSRQALLSSASPGPTGDSPLPQALVNAMPDGQSTTTLPPPTTDSSSPGSTTTATTVFMPNLLLVLQSPTHVSPAEAEGGPGWLEMAVMGALDDFETVPPAIISCVPPMMLEEAASSGSSSTLPFSTFDAALLDMPLSEVWRREARRHFE